MAVNFDTVVFTASRRLRGDASGGELNLEAMLLIFVFMLSMRFRGESFRLRGDASGSWVPARVDPVDRAVDGMSR